MSPNLQPPPNLLASELLNPLDRLGRAALEYLELVDPDHAEELRRSGRLHQLAYDRQEAAHREIVRLVLEEGVQAGEAWSQATAQHLFPEQMPEPEPLQPELVNPSVATFLDQFLGPDDQPESQPSRVAQKSQKPPSKRKQRRLKRRQSRQSPQP